eukprot:gnl/TRDRNA2_/TRDRNA2_83231_c0_seq1.p1 gnl/TRDRNA2_/TRDRNA2_83231_c0~~gnl/TRDRNA2_/TRDRNA2_83231_c0_seq1.p1  ORF type:complete len:232 (-),score=35.84 gnl/TRDRNA2_/TRDRNA2_83231_c0_seq1:58-753(-)
MLAALGAMPTATRSYQAHQRNAILACFQQVAGAKSSRRAEYDRKGARYPVVIPARSPRQPSAGATATELVPEGDREAETPEQPQRRWLRELREPLDSSSIDMLRLVQDLTKRRDALLRRLAMPGADTDTAAQSELAAVEAERAGFQRRLRERKQEVRRASAAAAASSSKARLPPGALDPPPRLTWSLDADEFAQLPPREPSPRLEATVHDDAEWRPDRDRRGRRRGGRGDE